MAKLIQYISRYGQKAVQWVKSNSKAVLDAFNQLGNLASVESWVEDQLRKVGIIK
ncbi:hypothetical protein BU090_11470 [Staphylococcus warneri]|uniref:aureocin A53 family class IId bacteriocin n=1 Tax=Staphylococcus TaxID=1279 RepID=UPI000A84EA50|nr:MULTISPECIES: aureocin A53 family class IId bacteriocin [Staphylococcus]MDH8827989.1 aureocin A53 family class IId bacteriocin [Staphylococcus capitis]MDH8926000.1 aureocin A53 family class IId bacteriocin [Staphylococcus capitis]MDH9838671.1 aureocin A53 family class IId bacteriocin [Staphylococcus capitis]MDS3984243.1 aureocin A53 family class IId bacteriocin [Staphylococcus capitis]MDS3997886.1 aureocin A53 family class IId bacteriocin [Staphylococcus capitis]